MNRLPPAQTMLQARTWANYYLQDGDTKKIYLPGFSVGVTEGLTISYTKTRVTESHSPIQHNFTCSGAAVLTWCPLHPTVCVCVCV